MQIWEWEKVFLECLVTIACIPSKIPQLVVAYKYSELRMFYAKIWI